MMNAIATMFGIGKSPWAPGTVGSLVAALLAFAVLHIPGGGWYVLMGGAVLFSLLGTLASDHYMRATGAEHDPSEIVVDELAGQWITYAVWYLWIVGITSHEASYTLLEVEAAPQFLVIGFFLFRFFDILKPWPIGWCDRKIRGGFGVMFDDVLAGFAAGSVLYAVYLFWPLMFGQLQEMP
jgi:phosphatidylglycerophosphatase A